MVRFFSPLWFILLYEGFISFMIYSFVSRDLYLMNWKSYPPSQSTHDLFHNAASLIFNHSYLCIRREEYTQTSKFPESENVFNIIFGWCQFRGFCFLGQSQSGIFYRFFIKHFFPRISGINWELSGKHTLHS